MLAHYKFEGNADDETGSYNGTATDIAYAAGKQGQAGVFNGTSSVVSVAHDAALVPASITVAGWFKVSAAGVALLTKYDDPNYSGYGLRINISGAPGFWVGDLSLGWMDSSSDVRGTAFRHIAGTYGAGTAKLYVDGLEVASASRTASFSDTSEIRLMRDNGPSGAYTAGSVDDLRIYNAVLSAAEVLALYNSYNGSPLLLRRRRMAHQ